MIHPQTPDCEKFPWCTGRASSKARLRLTPNAARKVDCKEKSNSSIVFKNRKRAFRVNVCTRVWVSNKHNRGSDDERRLVSTGTAASGSCDRVSCLVHALPGAIQPCRQLVPVPVQLDSQLLWLLGLVDRSVHQPRGTSRFFSSPPPPFSCRCRNSRTADGRRRGI